MAMTMTTLMTMAMNMFLLWRDSPEDEGTNVVGPLLLARSGVPYPTDSPNVNRPRVGP